MRRLTPYVLTFLLISAPRVAAQESTNGEPAPPATQPLPVDASLFNVGTSEWMLTAGPAFGVVIFHSAAGHRYTVQTVSWGQILSSPRGSGWWRGRFEWAVEVVPVYVQYAPTRTYGVGFSPLVWRWNFEPRDKLAPYAELAGGALFTGDPVPERTAKANFTAHLGTGVRIFLREQEALILGYRFSHISNGNRLDRNPGVNAHVLQFGWSYFRPRQ